jgi:hypothetical protein
LWTTAAAAAAAAGLARLVSSKLCLGCMQPLSPSLIKAATVGLLHGQLKWLCALQLVHVSAGRAGFW